MALDRDGTQIVRVVIRLIRSLVHKNIRNIVLREDVDGFNLSSTTVKDLMVLIRKKLSSGEINPPLPPPFKTFNFDCMKIEHQAFGSKTSNTVMNCENDSELILKEHLTLENSGVKCETEISFFNREDYEQYKNTLLS